MSWLEDLIDEYPTNRSDSAIERLARVFSEVSDETMQAAVDAYMLAGEKFFPKVGDLVPYVKEQQEQDRGPEDYDDIQQVKYGRWRSLTGEHYTDEEMLRWEQERGTMPDDDELGTDWADEPKELAL